MAQIVAGWPLAASLAALVVGEVHGGRRRTALNECLHELRRPLQALALAGPGASASEGVDSCLRMATEALERLDREINGGAGPGGLAPLEGAAALGGAAAPRGGGASGGGDALDGAAAVPVEPLLRLALARWRPRVELRGGSARLRWRAGEAAVSGDAARLEQALDNLLANAVEHGGAEVVVEARRAGRRLEIAVVDSGPPAARGPERGSGWAAKLSGRRRHGHGLRLVRRIAAEHGGGFELRRLPGRTEALLWLPGTSGAGAADVVGTGAPAGRTAP